MDGTQGVPQVVLQVIPQKYTPQSDKKVPFGGPTPRVVNSAPSSVAMSLLMVTAAITDVQLPTIWDNT